MAADGTISASPCTVRAVAAVLEMLVGDEGVARGGKKSSAQFRVVSYAEEFNFLWGTHALSSGHLPDCVPPNGQDVTLIVVWDGLPSPRRSSVVNTGRYLTPLDWAVGLSLEIADAVKLGRITPPGLRIFLLDLASHVEVTDSVRFFDLLPRRDLQLMPWIRLISPAGDVDQQWTIGSLIWNALAIEDVSSATRLPFLRESWSNGRGPAVDLIRRLWASGLTQTSEPGNHHAIANLVGPFVLLNEVEGHSHERALWRLLHQVGIIHSQVPEAQRSPAWIAWDHPNWATRTKFAQNRLNFLLIDDAAFSHRWGEVLCQALGLHFLATYQESGSAPELIGEPRPKGPQIWLYAAASANGWLTAMNLLPASELDGAIPDCRFGQSVPRENSSSIQMDVLFLDLRLFQGQSLETESQFYASLLPMAQRFLVEESDRRKVSKTKGELPWPGFTGQELNDIRSWIDSATRKSFEARTGHVYDLVLTILPRLLALLDTGLPIVLFSSTGRREIIDRLKPYGTILTEFEKPRLVRLGDVEAVAEVRARFADALAMALSLAKARQLCAALCAHYPIEPAPADVAAVASAEAPWRILLTLDEHQPDPRTVKGPPPLTVGGVLLVCPPSIDPLKVDGDVKKLPAFTDNKDQLKKGRQQVAEGLLNLCANTPGVFASVVTVTGEMGKRTAGAGQDDELHDERVGDNLHRHLVRCVVETAIYCVARRRIPVGAWVKFSIHAPTRYGRLFGNEHANNLRKRWGVAVEYVGRWDAPLWNVAHDLEPFLHKQIADPGALGDALDHVREFVKTMKGLGQPPRLMARYFGPDAARPLVEEVMREYDGAIFNPAAEIVRGFTINNIHSPWGAGTLALHLFADAVLSRDDNAASALNSLKGKGFHDKYGETLLTLLQAHRLFLRQEHAESIARGGPTWMHIPPHEITNASAVNAIGSDLAAAARRLTGEGFLRLARLLSADRPGNTYSERRQQGRVWKKTHSGLDIKGDDRVVYSAPRHRCEGFPGLMPNHRVSFIGQSSADPGVGCAFDVRRIRPSEHGA